MRRSQTAFATSRVIQYSRNKSQVRQWQNGSQTIAKFATYLSYSQRRVSRRKYVFTNYFHRLYHAEKIYLCFNVYIKIYVIGDVVVFTRNVNVNLLTCELHGSGLRCTAVTALPREAYRLETACCSRHVYHYAMCIP